MTFNPKDRDVQTAIDLMKENDQSDGEILDTLMSELDLSEDDANKAIDVNNRICPNCGTSARAHTGNYCHQCGETFS